MSSVNWSRLSFRVLSYAVLRMVVNRYARNAVSGPLPASRLSSTRANDSETRSSDSEAERANCRDSAVAGPECRR